MTSDSCMDTPGRTVISILGVPDSSSSVAPLAASAPHSRPGPESRCGLGISQPATAGKYNRNQELSLPDDDPTSSTSNRPSTPAAYHSGVTTVLPLEPTSVPAPAILDCAGSLTGRTDRVSLYSARSENAVVVPSVDGRRHDLMIFYQNVGGINSAVVDYRLAASAQCYDVIVLTETWLNDRTLSSQVFGPNYEVFRCDRGPHNSRKANGGGVLIAVRHGLKTAAIENQDWDCLEQVWITVELYDRKLLLCALYIPPDRTRDMDLIEVHCRSVFHVLENSTSTDELIVLGDFNLATVSWKPSHSGFLYPDGERSVFHAGALALLDSYSTATLFQINHVVNENQRSLDLCFVSARDVAPLISMAPAPLVKLVPHHPPLLVSIPAILDDDFEDFPASVSYDFRKADHRSITEVLTSLDWNTILDADDVEFAALTFSHVLSYVIDRHVPKKVHQQDSCHPWQTRELKKLKSLKRAALRKYSKYRTLPLKQHYVKLNYAFKRVSRQCFSRYHQNVQRKLKSHPKSFWKYVNQQRKESGLPSSMVWNDESASTPLDICRLFALKFANVFTDEILTDEDVIVASDIVPLLGQALSSIDVGADKISIAASQLKSSFNPGPDGVPSAFLKKHICSLLAPLNRLFQSSISNGIFPFCWKIAHMFPVHKKGSKRNVDNYRGISSLSAVSKLFELLVMDPLLSHVKQYLSEHQHGFTDGRSTTTNLLCLTSYITDSMAESAQTDVIYTDLSAAFDKLNHSIAIAKLNRLGVNGTLLQWFRSYLTGRKLMVAIGDCTSDVFVAKSGIPQGSHLGPLIFLLYFNDVNLALEGPRLSYADDLKLFLRIQSIADCYRLQQQLHNFANWCSINRMVVNPAKCSAITFSRKKEPIHFDYELSGTIVERTTHVKDLGVILDSQLTYKLHISYIVDKASRALGFIFRIAKSFSDIYCLKSLYCSLVRSTLEYCSAVWSPNYNNGVERVESVQRRFLRFALRKLPWSDPYRLPRYEDRCRLIDLEPLRIRRDTTRALTVADILQGRIDCSAILEQININVQPRALRNSLMLRLPFRRTNYSMLGAIGGMQRIFNRVASMFDFHVPRQTLRRRFSSFFASS